MELVGPTKRNDLLLMKVFLYFHIIDGLYNVIPLLFAGTLCGTAFSISFAVGVMVVAFWAFLIPNVEILQIIYGLHSLLLIGHWW